MLADVHHASLQPLASDPEPLLKDSEGCLQASSQVHTKTCSTLQPGGGSSPGSHHLFSFIDPEPSQEAATLELLHLVQSSKYYPQLCPLYLGKTSLCYFLIAQHNLHANSLFWKVNQVKTSQNKMFHLKAGLSRAVSSDTSPAESRLWAAETYRREKDVLKGGLSQYKALVVTARLERQRNLHSYRSESPYSP